MAGNKEAKARIRINKLLEDAGWRFFEDENGKANIQLEPNVKLKQDDIDSLGDDFNKVKNGFVDFLLLDEKGFPFLVLEAKREDKNPLDGKEQARKYAKSQNTRFVILSNGNLHYFWDLEFGNPTLITTFPTYESLKQKYLGATSFKPNPKNLINEVVEPDYVAITQKPDYHKDPKWIDELTRSQFIHETGIRIFRPYQLRAIQALQESVEKGNQRFLFEMATGTGKTLVSAGVIKLFLRTGVAKRVLFLVDRLELENQASKAFTNYLKNDFKTVIYKENKGDWRHAEIVVTTVQSLMFNNKYKDLFSPTDFDLVISDEAHRSIGGNSRAVFEYFTGYKLGLTATPKDYLKSVNIDKLAEDNPKKLERRQLLDTYKTFGCENSNPTFRYPLIDGVKDGYLINPIVVDARTEITSDLLSEKGYAIAIENEEGDSEEGTFFHKDFEKKFFSDNTNQIFCKTFLEKAMRDPFTKEIGKGIVFCVSQNHASKVTQILNEMAHQMFPGKYNSDFAVQITSNISDAQGMTINFQNNNLNGFSKFREGYKSSKTRICVTVGMMTTGYDCQDILNLAMMRPIFSPSDFIQIKGRGTRKFTFEYKDTENDEKHNLEKERFKLFDFFANCEYFEDKFDYDEKLKLPPIKGNGKGRDGEPVDLDMYKSVKPDPLMLCEETAIGYEGMKIDRKLFEKFEEVIKANNSIKDKIDAGNFAEAEEFIKREIFDKPNEYFNLSKLRKSLKLDRRVSLREILEKVFGLIKKFKSKDELLEEEIEKFISIYQPENKFIHVIRHFIKAYISDGDIRDIMETKQYQRLSTNPSFSMKDLKELNGWTETVVDYIKDYVQLNAFA
ncbi:restriction endonuclease subunit R [archaeon D22]|nr:restriction endonuclease subunit R [archaeon D22]